MKREIIRAAAVAAFFGAAGLAGAATYSVVEVKGASTSRQRVAGVAVAKAAYVEVTGALPAASTVTVQRISGTYTTTVATVTCTAGRGAAAATANTYLLTGDYLRQTGATNAPTSRVICEGE
jgi:hypothetical protein